MTAAPGHPRAIALLALAALFTYYNSLHGAFLFDDNVFVGDANVGRPWKAAMANRPVINWTLALNYWADGLNPRGYHVFNLAVHGLAAVVLYDLVRRTLLLPRFAGRYPEGVAGWVGLAAAAVWLVHPLNTQSVTYVVQRCESFMGLCFLAAVWCFLRGVTAERRAGWWHAAGVACIGLGVGSKEVAVTLPAVLVLFDRAFLAGSWRGVLGRWRVHAAYAAFPVGWFGWMVFGGLLAGEQNGTVGFAVRLFTPVTYALTQTEVLWHYLRLTAWPDRLVLDYLDWPERKSLGEVWPYAAGLAGLLAVTAYGVLRNRAWAAPAAACFLILAPTSSVVPIQDAAFEHRLYLPLACLVPLVVVGAWRLAAGRVPPRVTAAVAVVLVLALGFRAMVRNEDYASLVRMFGQNSAARPDNPRARGAFADVLRQTGQVAAAEAEIKAAVALPRNTSANAVVLGNVLLALGQLDEAAAYLAGVLAQTPDDPALNAQLGTVLVALGRPAAAIAPLEAARAKKPADVVVLVHLAIARHETGDAAGAAAAEAELKQRFPGHAAVLAGQARGMALAADVKPAHLRIAARQAALARRLAGPADPAAADAAALVQARLGNYPAAVEAASAAVAGAERAGWDADRLAVLRERVGLFRAGKPYLPADLAAYRGATP